MKTEIKTKFLPSRNVKLPPELQPVMKKAKRYEWITAIYLISVIVVMFLTLSSSQAMKAAWLEDVLSIVPSSAFLVASQFFNRPPTVKFPYGFHRTFSLGFIFGAFALFGMGVFVSVDSAITLLHQEHPTIGFRQILGQQIWFGWVMILALLYSFIPAVILGRRKKPLALKLHNKLLNVDADAQKADWMTAGAAILGILGIGLGFWWADAVAALFISFSILRDGIQRLRSAITDFLGHIPTKVGSKEPSPINKQLIIFFEKQDWVKDVRVRIREEGQVFLGEVFVIPKETGHLLENIEQSYREISQLDWKIHEITIQPVRGF